MKFLTVITLWIAASACHAQATPSASYCDSQTPTYLYNNHFYMCANGVPVRIDAQTAGATMFVYGDSHPSGAGLPVVALSYPSIIGSLRNWNVTNLAAAGARFADQVFAAMTNYTTRNIQANSVTLQNMGTNDVTAYSVLHGGGASAPTTADAQEFTANFRAWLVYNGTSTSNFVYGNAATSTTGSWVGYTTVIATGPPQTLLASGGGASGATATYTVKGNRVDLLTTTYSPQTSTFTWTVDGVSQTCSFPNSTTCVVGSNLPAAGSGGASLIASTARGLTNTTHTVVVTNGANTNGVGVFGVVGTDTNVLPSLRPLVLASYVSRFGTANAGYANHTDTLVAAFKALQVAEMLTLKTDGFNIVPVDYCNAPGPGDITNWWNPNDANQTQSDWQHPNYIGHQYVAKAFANALALYGK